MTIKKLRRLIVDQPFRQSQKDSSSIEEKMLLKVTLPSTLIFSAKDVRTINLTVSCYLYLYSKPCEKCPGGGGGGTSIYRLYRYVPRNRVWFLRFSVLK